MDCTYLNRPQFWRMRAEETRCTAEMMVNAECRGRLLRCAEEYEAIGDCIERTLRDLLGEANDDRSQRDHHHKVTPFRPTG